MTFSPYDTLWSGRGEVAALHGARLFGRPIQQSFDFRNSVIPLKFVKSCVFLEVLGALLYFENPFLKFLLLCIVDLASIYLIL
jgi:hypothetical protein